MAEYIIPQTRISLEDYVKLGGTWYEVINGVLAEKNMTAGFAHSLIIGNVVDVLKIPVQAQKLGYVFGHGLIYILHVNDNGVQASRIPDASFIRKSSLPDNFDRSRPLPCAPDLAIEIISPTKSTADLMGKVRDYLRYGTEQIWAIYPKTRELHQYLHNDNQPRTYTVDDSFEVTTLFPDFVIKIADFFADNE